MKSSKRKHNLIILILSMIIMVTNVISIEAKDSLHNVSETLNTSNVVEPIIIRHQGRSREDVAIDVTNTHFKNTNKVILVNRDKYPDAISATNISQGDYPVLYTRVDDVDGKTISLLKSMNLDEIYILGGTLSVSDNVVTKLSNDLSVKVTRVAGRSRYDVNVNAIRQNHSKASHLILASGEVYADALYGVSYANTMDAPVVLSNTNTLSDSTIQLLEDLDTTQVTIIGGKLSVTGLVESQLGSLGISVNRIAGRNRYIGSAEVARSSYETPQNVVIASGEVFSDALVSAPLAQKLNAPILLVKNDQIDNEVNEYLKDKKESIDRIYIQGGPLTISAENEAKIKQSITSYEELDSIIINNNIPFFTNDEITSTDVFHQNGPLDSLGRVTVANALVGQDILPEHERGSISRFYPTGWNQARYANIGSGGWLYNRSHLIGFQLTGNDDYTNLMTGTRWFNMRMLEYENFIANYVETTDNHVRYRVTPDFEGSNLVASGLYMEGFSIEDNGEGLMFNVYVPNKQPEVIINYEDGSSIGQEGPAAEGNLPTFK